MTEKSRKPSRDLLPVGHRDECRAQCDLGLPEAHVAANEAIHRLAALQIRQRRVDGRGLVGRLLEWKTFGERLVVMLLQLEGEPFA